jgi:hypothetical protein
MAEKKPTRKGNIPIYVWVTPDEKAVIESFAKQTGHSTSAYLRLLGQGYVSKSIVDHGKVMARSWSLRVLTATWGVWVVY